MRTTNRPLRPYEIAVYCVAVLVMIFMVLDFTLCPPCQMCIGTRIGQVCIETIDPVKPPAIFDGRIKG